MSLKYVLGTVGGLALAAVVIAQTPPPGPKSTVPQPPPVPSTAPTAPYPPTLYQMPDVGKSLNLTPDQITRLNTVTADVQGRYRDNYAKLGSLPEADRAARMRELNTQYHGDWNKSAGGVFNDTQLSRYQQLQYQYGGFNTLYDPTIQTKLGLTAEQTKALADQVGWNDRQRQEINRTAATDPTRATQMYGDYWRQRQERFNTYLTPQQQKVWREMTGEPYTFQPTFQRR